MAKAKTTSQFILDSKKIHGDKYNYELVEYVNNKTKVNIICQKHDIFKQIPKDHLRGTGCPKCAGKNKTTESVIEEFKKAHGDRYGYSKVDYKKDGIKVIIECFEHGFFEQTPSNHLNGSGCPKCSGNVNLTTKEFIDKAIDVHGNKYDYSNVEYKSSYKKVSIFCKSHGIFYQRAFSHLRGHGCPKCIGLNKNTDYVIKEFKQIHGNRYDYSLVDYVRNDKKVKIICKKHGLFEQPPVSHLSGHGCFKCGIDLTAISHQETPVGWSVKTWEQAALKSKNFDSFKVYIIKCWNDNEEFYKIGRTFTTINKRFVSLPYKYDMLKCFVFNNARECFNMESELKKLNKANKYVPLISFGGMYECFSKII